MPRLVRDVRGLGFAPYVVVATRDARSSLRSKVRTHQRRARVAADEQAVAAAALAALVGTPLAPTFVFSYEAFVLLGRAYLRSLLDFLDLPPPSAAEEAGPDSAAAAAGPRPTRDGNADWQFRRTPGECGGPGSRPRTDAARADEGARPRRWLAHLAVAAAAGRAPACRRSPPPPL